MSDVHGSTIAVVRGMVAFDLERAMLDMEAVVKKGARAFQ
jgi:hypothetical protein